MVFEAATTKATAVVMNCMCDFVIFANIFRTLFIIYDGPFCKNG